MNSTISKQLDKYTIIANKNQFLENIKEMLGKGGGYYLALNPEKILNALQDKSIECILSTSAFLIVDGVGAQWALKTLKGIAVDRVTGVDAMDLVLNYANEKKLSVGILGAKQNVVDSLEKIFKKKYTGCCFKFILSGYGKDLELVHEVLGEQGVDIVFVGLGSPKQEKWIIENCKKYTRTYFTGVGGSLDVFSGNVARAPAWVCYIGLEWLYRFALQPVRRFKRTFRLFVFVVLVLKEKVVLCLKKS